MTVLLCACVRARARVSLCLCLSICLHASLSLSVCLYCGRTSQRQIKRNTLLGGPKNRELHFFYFLLHRYYRSRLSPTNLFKGSM